MTSAPQYDYIIAGSGCAGLSLLVQILKSGKLQDKKILLVDQSAKTENDRTWCFWEKGTGAFEDVVSSRWNRMWYRSPTLARSFELSPYQYKLIRGIDFYRYAFDLVSASPQVEHRLSAIKHVGEDPQGAFVETAEGKVYGKYVFNSILFDKPVRAPKQYTLLQHFRGWFVKTINDEFDPEAATLMDFRVSQDKGTAFVYVMPFSRNEALVEYTLFSREVLKDEDYETGLRSYMQQQLKIDSYEISQRESGIIPMTNYRFPNGSGSIVNIGTAGGRTRGSTGYTFQFIQQQSGAIVAALAKGSNPMTAFTMRDKRFEFYDSILLNILYNETLPGHEIFTRLFGRNDPRDVLRFLDKESSLLNDLKLVATLPTIPFMKAALQQL